MIVYRIEVNCDKFQTLTPEVEKHLDFMTFDCKSRTENWGASVEWFCLHPNYEVGNFLDLGGVGAFAFDQEVYDSDLFTFFEMGGEALPIRYLDRNWYVLNVLECLNALDSKKTVRKVYPSGNIGRILEYHFHIDRWSESSIFKIPETAKIEVLTVSGLGDPEDDFISAYLASGFTGLEFTEIWRSD